MGLKSQPLAVVVPQSEPTEISDATGAPLADRRLHEISKDLALQRLASTRTGRPARFLDSKRNPWSESAHLHVALTGLRQCLEEGVTVILDLQARRHEGPGVKVDPDPVRGLAQGSAALRPERSPKIRVGLIAEAPGVVEAVFQIAPADPPGRMARSLHSLNQCPWGLLVEAIGSIR